MELLEFNREQKASLDLMAATKSLVWAGIKSSMKTLQILSDEDSILGKP